MRKRRPQRGWIMLAVLGLLLLCTLLATGLYTQSEAHLLTGKAMATQQIAVQRAEAGFQIALQGLRSTAIVPPAGLPFCIESLASNCPTSARVSILPVDNGNVLSLTDGGGLQYQYYIIRRNLPGTPANRFVIQSVGYYGFAPVGPATPHYLTAIVEGDVDIGTVGSATANKGSEY